MKNCLSLVQPCVSTKLTEYNTNQRKSQRWKNVENVEYKNNAIVLTGFHSQFQGSMFSICIPYNPIVSNNFNQIKIKKIFLKRNRIWIHMKTETSIVI